jgi:membrane protein DedA with SNARE-associated domain
MTGWSQGIMQDFGYVGIAFLMLIENLFPPIPSEVVLPLAGSATTSRELGLVLVIVAATVGSLVGALALYWAGAALGRERLERFTKRHGRWLTLAPKDLERAESWFERHGGKAVLVCRFIPGLRSLISVPAGVVRMELKRFLALSALGTVIW